jgi:hypothetical protein
MDYAFTDPQISMMNITDQRKNGMLLLLAFIFLTIGLHVFGQDSLWVYGTWRIENMAFVSPPPSDELNHVIKVCQNGKVIITKSKFIFKASGCSLLRSMKDFRITKQYTLYSNDSDLNVNYATKTIYYLFDDGKRKSIRVCKTNYTFESNEGDVPELEIFIVDRSHLIINQYENMFWLKKD